MPYKNPLPFERPIVDLEDQLAKLEAQENPTPNTKDAIRRIRLELTRMKREIFSNLDAWQIVQVARHGDRPQTLDYIELVFDEFVELHGDRAFGDDRAILTGFAKLDEYKVLFVGQQKGRTLKERTACNFGCAHPEGYRKALAKMKLAAKFGLPVVALIDTPGAYPGIGAEERGQAEAIARSTEMCLNVKVPIVTVVIGEGGSGGAIAIATASRVLMLEHAMYSVISPEGAASILWRDSSKAQEAATSMKITAQDLARFGVIDLVITEPIGGAHSDPAAAATPAGAPPAGAPAGVPANPVAPANPADAPAAAGAPPAGAPPAAAGAPPAAAAPGAPAGAPAAPPAAAPAGNPPG